MSFSPAIYKIDHAETRPVRILKPVAKYHPLFVLLYLAVAGMFAVFSVMLYVGGSADIKLGFSFMAIILFVYAINRYTDTFEDFINDTPKLMFFTKQAHIHSIATMLLVAGTLWFIASRAVNIFFLVLVVFGAAYSYHCIPIYRKARGIVFIRLKGVPLVKNLIVAVLWGISMVVIPLMAHGTRQAGFYMLALLGGSLALSTFNNTLFSDIRDREGDRQANNNTLPVIFGNRATYLFMALLNMVWLGFIIGIVSLGGLDIPHLIFITAMSLHPLAYIVPFQLGWISRRVSEILAESDLALFAGGVYLLSRVV